MMTVTFLPVARPLSPLGTKAKGLVEADDVVDPGFEHGWHIEVVHGSGDDDFVGCEQLSDELVRELEAFLCSEVC
jgi:hypothetical protein